MSHLDVLLATKAVLTGALALWFALIVLQNTTDRRTNVALIGRVLAMQPVPENPDLGTGLRWRAVVEHRIDGLAGAALTAIVILQVAVTATLGLGAALLAWQGGDPGGLAGALVVVDVGLLLAMVHWFALMCGGLWFGYWITVPQVQQVHMTMLIVTLVTLSVVNVVPPVP